MRGDSVRDLYAKTLALLGLGVLAGAGALVDYWPVGLSYPQAGVALEAPSRAAAFPVLSADSLASPVSRARVAAAPPHIIQVAQTAGVVDALPVAMEPRVDVGRPLSLNEPTIVLLASMPEIVPEPAVVAFADYQSPASTSDRSLFDDAALAPVDSDSDGIITGAFKKARTSIVNAGVRTGSSIFDAARVIGGAVRKALPN